MKCYICNRELTSEKNLSEEEKVNLSTTHREHIIHNAILGRLITNNILCKECGSNYSANDAAFTSLFYPFVKRLENFDVYCRRSTNSHEIHGYLHTCTGISKKEVVEKNNGEVYSTDMKCPDYTIDDANKNIVVTAPKERVETFRKQMTLKDAKYVNFTFTSKDYLAQGNHIAYFFSEKKSRFNEHFKQGIVKIALEFAIDRGIDRTYMPDILNIDKKGYASVIYDCVDVIPYTPLTKEENEYEIRKHTFVPFPQHLLRLYNIENPDSSKSLVCYIELFSTFQYFVILNSKYEGPDIDVYYGQRIFKEYDNISKKELSAKFDVPKHLESISQNPETFRKVIYDNETQSFMPNVWLCKGLYTDKIDIVKKYTTEKFKKLELFLWG